MRTELQYRLVKSACTPLTDAESAFAQCADVVDPKDYFDICMRDMCQCRMTGSAADCDKVRCAVMAHYTRKCGQQGVVLNGWRADPLCKIRK